MFNARQALIAAVLMLGTATAANADGLPTKMVKVQPNCTVNNKKIHIKDKAACEKQHGFFIEATAGKLKGQSTTSTLSTPPQATTSPAPVAPTQPQPSPAASK